MPFVAGLCLLETSGLPNAVLPDPRPVCPVWGLLAAAALVVLKWLTRAQLRWPRRETRSPGKRHWLGISTALL